MHDKNSLMQELEDALIDDEQRKRLQFMWIYRILMVVSLFMTVVNVITQKHLLGWSTFIFAIACGVDILIVRYRKDWLTVSAWMFTAEIIILFTFFIISGTPEGFSAIWICLLPSCGLLLFGRKYGTMGSALMLAIVVFFFDTPWGIACLQYNYTDSFRLRFPMLYIAFYGVSLFLETVRVLTHKKLVEMQEQYRYLYTHDALTGLFNRYGFNQLVNQAFDEEQTRGLSLMIFDIDHFKHINDTYGHISGDHVLKEVASQLAEAVGEQGAVCRWGGEEFAILISNTEAIEALGEKICESIRKDCILVDADTIRLTISGGIFSVKKVLRPCSGHYIQRADQCLYRAKELGRDRIETEILEEY